MAVGFVASASSGSQASVASFNIGTLGTGARAGIVFVATHGTGDLITGVTWNSVAMTRLFRAADTDTEPGSVVAYFLDNVSNGVVTVSRTNNAVVTVGYAASISAASATEAFQTITRAVSTQNTDADTTSTGTGASGEVAVDDGSPGTSSMRFAAAYTGAATPVGAGTNSSLLQSLDSTALGSSFVRETTAGQGSRSVGFATGTTDDWALVAVAVREIPPLVVTPGVATLTTATFAPTVTASDNQLVIPGVVALTIATFAPTVNVGVNVIPATASLALATFAPTVAISDNQTVTPGVLALSMTAFAPTVVASDNKLVTPSTAALSLATFAPTVTASLNITVIPATASLTLTTFAPTVSGVTVTPPSGGFHGVVTVAPDPSTDDAYVAGIL